MREDKEMDGILYPRLGENLDIVLRSKIREWGNSQVCKGCQEEFLPRDTLPRGLCLARFPDPTEKLLKFA